MSLPKHDLEVLEEPENGSSRVNRSPTTTQPDYCQDHSRQTAPTYLVASLAKTTGLLLLVAGFSLHGSHTH